MKSALEDLLIQGKQYISDCPEENLNKKISRDKWSKKEILGHLIDSGINNLQRFTEIQFQDKPYQVRPYDQDELVKANDYQNSDSKQLLDLWLTLNFRIAYLIGLQTDITLNYELRFEDGQTSNLASLIQDYLKHTKHHLDQIVNK
jgi:hypothetical protein